jgi:DNA-binding beta-propeller fold protein YncE
MKKSLFVLFLLATAHLSGQWFEQMMYIPDSLSGCIYSGAYVWNQVDDQLCFPCGPNIVVIDCATDEKTTPIRLRNSLESYCFTYHSTNNCLYSPTTLAASVCTLYAINCQNRQVVAQIPIHFQPSHGYADYFLSTNPISNKVYLNVCDLFHPNDSIFIIDAGTNQIIRSIGFNGVWSIFFNPRHNNSYALSPNAIYVLDGVTDSIIDTIATPRLDLYHNSTVLDTINDRFYVLEQDSLTKLIGIDCSTNQIIMEAIILDTIAMEGTELAIDLIHHELFVSPAFGSSGKTIWVIDPIQGIVKDSICTEFYLTGVKYCSINNRLYASTRGHNLGSMDTILIINPVNHQVAGFIDLGGFEPNLHGDNIVWFLNPLRNKLYVSLWSSYLAVIDCAANRLTKELVLGVLQSDGSFWNPITDRLYCSDTQGPFVYCFDGSTNQALYTRELPIPGYGLYEFALAPSHNKIYVGFPGGVVVLDGAMDTVIRVIWIPTGVRHLCYNFINDKIYGTGYPYTYAINCANDEIVGEIYTLYASQPYYNPRTNKVYVAGIRGMNPMTCIIDCAGDTLLATLNRIAGSVAFREIGELVYISSADSLNSLVILDGRTNQVIQYLPDLASSGLVYNSFSDRLYCTNRNSLVLDCATNIIIDTLPAGVIFHNPINNKLYCSDSNSIVVIDGATNEIIARFNEIGSPSSLIWNSLQNRHYIPGASQFGVIRDVFPGVEENHNSLSAQGRLIEIYPNPARSYFVVRLPHTVDRQNLKIFDVSGKLVRSLELNNSKSLKESEVRISLKGINPGIYFLQLGTVESTLHPNRVREVKKFLVVK